MATTVMTVCRASDAILPIVPGQLRIIRIRTRSVTRNVLVWVWAVMPPEMLISFAENSNLQFLKDWNIDQHMEWERGLLDFPGTETTVEVINP